MSTDRLNTAERSPCSELLVAIARALSVSPACVFAERGQAFEEPDEPAWAAYARQRLNTSIARGERAQDIYSRLFRDRIVFLAGVDDSRAR